VAAGLGLAEQGVVMHVAEMELTVADEKDRTGVRRADLARLQEHPVQDRVHVPELPQLFDSLENIPDNVHGLLAEEVHTVSEVRVAPPGFSCPRRHTSAGR